MKRAAGAALALVAAAAFVAASPRPSPSASRAPKPAASATPSSPDAPADVYFGPFKYSALSLRSKIGALGRAYRERWEDDASLVHDADMLKTAYDDWARRYPHDRWLAPTAFHLAQLYGEIQSDAARSRAKALYAYVAQTFPNTKEGHLSRLRLQQGFPPFRPESPVSPTPNPYPSASPSPEASYQPPPLSPPPPPPKSPPPPPPQSPPPPPNPPPPSPQPPKLAFPMSAWPASLWKPLASPGLIPPPAPGSIPA